MGEKRFDFSVKSEKLVRGRLRIACFSVSPCEAGKWMEEDDEDDPADGAVPVALDWDEPGIPCLAELAYIWNGFQSGERQLDLKQVLGSTPRFTGLPSKPHEDNFRGDSHRRDDKERKAWQQSLLHALQLFAFQYNALKA